MNTEKTNKFLLKYVADALHLKKGAIIDEKTKVEILKRYSLYYVKKYKRYEWFEIFEEPEEYDVQLLAPILDSIERLEEEKPVVEVLDEVSEKYELEDYDEMHLVGALSEYYKNGDYLFSELKKATERKVNPFDEEISTFVEDLKNFIEETEKLIEEDPPSLRKKKKTTDRLN